MWGRGEGRDGEGEVVGEGPGVGDGGEGVLVGLDFRELLSGGSEALTLTSRIGVVVSSMPGQHLHVRVDDATGQLNAVK
jgi:hypothetical protein